MMFCSTSNGTSLLCEVAENCIALAVPAVCRSALHASLVLDPPALHIFHTTYVLAQILCMPDCCQQTTSPNTHCQDPAGPPAVYVSCWAGSSRSVLQVVHHISHTHCLLTNDGVAVFVEASIVTASAFVFKLVAYMLLHIAAGLPPALSVRAGTATQLIAGSFCAFSWSTGQFAVHLTSPSIPHIGSCLQFVFSQCDANASPL